VIDGVSLSAVEGTQESVEFLSGVIEGFYGKPWTLAERVELFGWMAAWGLNTYVYAPKDDLHHRALWREPYSSEDAGQLAQVIQACQERNLRFIYALSPGLDIRYRDDAELASLQARVDQLHGLGCRDFSLLFDDIPGRLNPQDTDRWGSLASAQCHVANALFQWTRERLPRASSRRFIFCPTAYCGRMAARKLGGDGYLATVGRELLPEIDIFWTGPDIVSRTITVAHVEELGSVLQRKPVIWDNLHANDYDPRRIFCGPYSGRPRELRSVVGGLLSNPNNEFPLNHVPLRTLAAFARGDGDWSPRDAYIAAMREWLPSFATIGEPVALEDLVLFADCYYLPHEEGTNAEALYACARRLVTREPTAWEEDSAAFRRQAARLREFCIRITELRHRPLFHALFRRIWELRETLDLMERYLTSMSASFERDREAPAAFHFQARGGFVPRLERLLTEHATGSAPTVHRNATTLPGLAP
jgi:protein O-GlcNAcase/histone acetyltransferase